MGVSMKLRVVIALLAICASAFTVGADQPDDQRDDVGSVSGIEPETDARLRGISNTQAPDEYPETALAASQRTPFSGRRLTLQQRRIFVLGLQAQEKK